MNIQTSSQVTRHPNADAIIAYVNDTSLPVFYWHSDRLEWVQTGKPNWNPHIHHFTGHNPPVAPPRPVIDFHGHEIQEPLPNHTAISGEVYHVVLGDFGFFPHKISGEFRISAPFYHLTQESAQLHANALNALCGVSNV